MEPPVPPIPPSPRPPSGRVTFLFTDIEGSTARWEQYPQEMGAAVARHDTLLRRVIEARGGYIFKTLGDAFFAAFAQAPAALEAALEIQRLCATVDWGRVGPIRVRIALHTGSAEERAGDYFGPPLNRVARLLAVGSGAQTVLSQTAQEQVRPHLPAGVTLRHLGAHRLKDLIHPEQIFQLVAPDLPADFPPLKTLATQATNLPVQPTPLIGRERQLAEAVALLRQDRVRLVTFTGPGGMGKTRLSLQVAAEVLDEFPHGAFWVPLVPITDAALVAPTIATTLGVREIGGQPLVDTLKEYLRDKHLLLVLDNFEQVLPAAALVADLLTAAGGLKVLVTSRSVLRVRGEKEFAVGPLALPDPRSPGEPQPAGQYAAVQLFLARAQDVQPDFTLTPENAPAVIAICARLDGMPLAIELAAARSKLLAPGALLARLEQRLALLTSGARDLPARHQTLRGTIAWSYDLLDSAGQRLFRRLAVFAGGCTLEAAAAVCQGEGEPALDILEGMGALVDQSLLRQQTQPNGEPRFWMLETIREYAGEKLAESGEGATIQDRHLGYFHRWVQQAEPQLFGPAEGAWRDQVEGENDNLRAALAWAVDGNPARPREGWELIDSLYWFWGSRGHVSEGRGWYERGLHRQGATAVPKGMRARMLRGVGGLARQHTDTERAAAALEESLGLFRELADAGGMGEVLQHLAGLAEQQRDWPRVVTLGETSSALLRQVGDKVNLCFTLHTLASAARWQGDNPRATGLYEESLQVAREVGSNELTAWATFHLAQIAQAQGAYESAARLFQESLPLFRAIQHPLGLVTNLTGLAEMHLLQGQYGPAAELLTAGLRILQERGLPEPASWTLDLLGIAACGQGAYEQAAAYFQQALRIDQACAYKQGIGEHLAGLGRVALGRRQWERGIQLLAAASALLAASGATLGPADQQQYDQSLALAQAQVPAATFAAWWATGSALTEERAVIYALADEPASGSGDT